MPTTGLGKLQRQLWVLFDDPSSSTGAKLLSGFMMSVILLSIASYTFASTPAETMWVDVWVNSTTGEVIPGSTNMEANVEGAHLSDSPRRVSSAMEESRSPYFEIETFCIAVFTAEYFTRLFASPQGPGVLRYLIGLWNVVDLVSILPFYAEIMLRLLELDTQLSFLSVLRLFRLTRITRIFKMSKNLEGLVMLQKSLQKSGPALLMLFSFMAIAGVFFSTLIYTFEAGSYDEHRRQYVREDGSPSPFESIPASFWWTIITMTTVGYGDVAPVSSAGKVVAVLTMFCGLVVLSLPITIIGANFDDEYRELRKRAQDEKERGRRKERAALLQQRAAADAQSKANPATPAKGGDDAGAAGATDDAPLTFPPSPSPLVDGGGGGGNSLGEDPIKLIQTMIHEAHYALTMEVEKLVVDHENKLRLQIKQVLRRHASGVDAHGPTALEQMRAHPSAE